MTVELTPQEAELLIALLKAAEGAFAVVNPLLVEALNDLRPWRSALLQAYIREISVSASDQLRPLTPGSGESVHSTTRA